MLRIATARSGEGLSAVAARTGNVWSPERTAVVNGMAGVSAPLPGGRLKIAVEVPYTSLARER